MKLLRIFICMLLGYLLGTLSPSALFGKLKKVDLRNQGTGNLGATNTMLVLGKAYGAVVMLFDISKAYLAAILARLLCADVSIAPVLAGAAAVAGHIYPFYLNFKGGRGLAPFAGLVLYTDPLIFLFLLVFCTTLMIAVNYSIAMPWSAGALFPFLVFWKSGDLALFFVCLAVSALIIYKHYPNFIKAINGEDRKIRDHIRTMFSK
ncbi:MAG: glycerol-3-phosphate acyltransferase [Clostridia bacterium]|nr:glycerol-3-phosphate acyltransferase [Clostridia bacterium]